MQSKRVEEVVTCKRALVSDDTPQSSQFRHCDVGSNIGHVSKKIKYHQTENDVTSQHPASTSDGLNPGKKSCDIHRSSCDS